MSVFNKLKNVQEIRQNKYTQALQKSPLELAQNAMTTPITPSEIHLQFLKTQAMFKWILVLLVLLFLAVGLLIVLLLSSSLFEKKIKQPTSIQLTKPETATKATSLNNPSLKKTSKK